ncbi:hypothetical protein EGJ89_10485 [Stenotrophomonas maltophilia]|nr:hypothetical protein EGJ89_10485 [Stenotrophomonas maltophilia]
MRKCVPGLLACVMTLLYAAPAAALDPQEKNAQCDALRDSASKAVERAIAVYVPKQNPSRTFTDATKMCLQVIVQYNKIPMGMIDMGIMQPILRQLGEDLLMKECSAAADRFNQTLRDALGERGLSLVNGQLQYSGNVGGVSVNAGVGANGGTVTASGSGVTGSANTNGDASVKKSGGLLNWGGK